MTKKRLNTHLISFSPSKIKFSIHIANFLSGHQLIFTNDTIFDNSLSFYVNYDGVFPPCARNLLTDVKTLLLFSPDQLTLIIAPDLHIEQWDPQRWLS